MRDLRYILKRVIIGILIGLGIMFFKNNVSFAMTYDCGGTFKLNGQTLSTSSTKTISAGTNYTFSVENLSVDVDNATAGDLFYTDVEFLSNLAFGDYTGTSNGVTFQIMRTGLQAPGLFDGQKDGVIRVRYLWQSNDVLGQTYPTMRRTGTVYNYGGSVNYLGGIRIKSITCGYQSEMPSLDEYSMEQINQLKAIKGSLDNLRTGIETANDIHRQELEKLGEIGQTMLAVEDAMKDDSFDGDFQNSKINEIAGKQYGNASISDIILLPVRLLQVGVDALSSNTCSSFNLGAFYGTDIVLPCYSSSNISGWFGSSVLTIIDVLMSFGIILGIRKLVIKIYKTIVFLRDGGGTID